MPGALANLSGDNEWAANIILGSPAPNGNTVTIFPRPKEVPSSSAAVVSGSQNLDLKQDNGNLIFSNQNTYSGTTDIRAGTLTIPDSKRPGDSGAGGTTVEVNASLALQVDSGFDPARS